MQDTAAGASPPPDLEDAAESELSVDQEEEISSKHRPARALKAHKIMELMPDLVGEIMQGPGFLSQSRLQQLRQSILEVNPTTVALIATLDDIVDLTAQAVAEEEEGGA